MKRGLLIAGLASITTLVILFGIRASTDALAVILGVVLGVAASVPTTILVTYILLRPNTGGYAPPPQSALPLHPPVVVINTTDKPAISAPAALPAPGLSSQPRRWTVIGDADTVEDQ
jgi:hypothetical protein